MLVTRDYGGVAVRDRAVTSGQSTIAALQTIAKVTTAYSGGFVQSIDGVAGSRSGERDWFFYVDGIEADRGGADLSVRPGQTIWWDHRLWKNRMRVPVVIGTWPEPFLHGYTSDPAGVAADAPLDSALRAAGATVVAPGVRSTYAALVGADAQLRQRSSAWAGAEKDPAGRGMTAWFSADGRAHVWNAATQQDVAVPTATAILAAVSTGTEASDGVTFVVAGTTAASASAAAAALVRAPALITHSYAVCLDASGRVVCRGGRGLSS